MPITIYPTIFKYKDNNGEYQSINAIKGDPGEVTQAELSSELDDKAPVITSSASGSIVQIEDGADGMPVKNLMVQIEPVQDLHGYDSPWPAGGGKNKLPYLPNTAGTYFGVTVSYDSDNNAYVLDGTYAGPGNISLSNIPKDQLPIQSDMESGVRIMSVSVVSGSFTIADGTGNTYAVALFNSNYANYIRSGNTAQTANQLDGYYGWRATGLTSDGDYHLLFQCWRTGTVFNNLKIRIQLEEADSTSALPTAWTPYSNICPISGWTDVDIFTAGENLVPTEDKDYTGANKNIHLTCENGIFTLANVQPYPLGVTALISQSSGTVETVFGKRKRLLPGTYSFSVEITSLVGTTDVTNIRLKLTDYITEETRSIANGGTLTITEPLDIALISCQCVGGFPEGASISFKVNLERSATLGEWKPFEGKTYPIELPSEAGTVYGGELTVNEDGTGKIKVDMAETDLGETTIVYNEDYEYPYFSLNMPSDSIPGSKALDAMSVYCQMYKTITNKTGNAFRTNDYSCSMCLNSGVSTRRLLIQDNRFTSEESLRSAITGVPFVYTLETPIEYTLNAAQVQTILGLNNVWADAGNVDVIYRADTKLYSDSHVARVQDVQVNGTSVLSNGVANVPMASTSGLGAVRINSSYGVKLNTSGVLQIQSASIGGVKPGTNEYYPITPNQQHSAAFYGLAKAAGDSTQSTSSNVVGAYTETAKSKIHTMLNGSVAVSGTTPTITGQDGIRYVCGEVSTISVTPPASGIIDVVFDSGTTPAVLTIVGNVRWANGFDPDNLDANTTYEINIADGLGVAGKWT